jgi:catechol 2,3-dioxygenase-like lactoylglutathione lyase family enzyme
MADSGGRGGDGRVGDLHLGTVVVDVQDMDRAIRFWTAALGYQPREQDPDPQFMILVHPAGRGLPVALQLAGQPPREPVRLHLDLYTGEQAQQVQRLAQLGATQVTDWPYPEDADFIVMRDPDGNEFCVIDHPEL